MKISVGTFVIDKALLTLKDPDDLYRFQIIQTRRAYMFVYLVTSKKIF